MKNVSITVKETIDRYHNDHTTVTVAIVDGDDNSLVASRVLWREYDFQAVNVTIAELFSALGHRVD